MKTGSFSRPLAALAFAAIPLLAGCGDDADGGTSASSKFVRAAVAPGLGAEIIDCPVAQSKVGNDAAPDAELFAKLLRCAKGEKGPTGSDGSVGVEVTDLDIGQARLWSYRQDAGNGQEGTMVYPVKATYTVRTFYNQATETESGWVRVLNYYVNPFGEWQIGSEEPVSPPTTTRTEK